MDFVPDGECGQFAFRVPFVLGDDVVPAAVLGVDGAQAVADVNEESTMYLGRVGQAGPLGKVRIGMTDSTFFYLSRG